MRRVLSVGFLWLCACGNIVFHFHSKAKAVLLSSYPLDQLRIHHIILIAEI